MRVDERPGSVADTASGPTLGTPRQMTILFDEKCAFCRRCAQWLVKQRAAIPTSVVPSSNVELTRRYGAVEGYGQELMVIGDNGQIWTGADAFIVAMWCLASYRTASMRLSGPIGHTTARAFFNNISANRSTLGEWLDGDSVHEGCSPCRDQG